MKLRFVVVHSTTVLISIGLSMGTLDLTNLDLQNVKFFKYPQVQTGEIVYRRYQPFNIFDPVDQFNRVKAMLEYFTEVLLGNSNYKRKIEIFFHPDTGSKLRPHFEHKFGHRGARLIAALGNGYQLDLVRHGTQSRNQ